MMNTVERKTLATLTTIALFMCIMTDAITRYVLPVGNTYSIIEIASSIVAAVSIIFVATHLTGAANLVDKHPSVVKVLYAIIVVDVVECIIYDIKGGIRLFILSTIIQIVAYCIMILWVVSHKDIIHTVIQENDPYKNE